MEFRILGPLEVLDEGQEVALAGSKQRALLGLLLVHANEALDSERLIDELWGERPPPTAAKTLHVHVSRLRKALASGTGDDAAREGFVLTREHGYELRLDPERLDARRFERLVAEARHALAAGRPEHAVSALERGLSLWRGRPLADLAYEPFAQDEIVRLEELRVTAREQLVEAKLALGRHAEVVGPLESLIGEHPYREGLHAQLMLALYRCDRQADALQAYQNARKTLVEELGIEPGERLRDLERAILAQDPRLALAEAESPRSGFVGRAPELAQLVAGLDGAFAGRGRLFLLEGEPGIGKSRLAEELIVQASARGARVLVGRCWEAGGAPAYWPWVQALRAYARETDPATLQAQLGTGAADVAQLLPELRQHLPDLPQPRPLESEGARFRLFDATAEFLRNASASRPTVLVLDDLHAADAPSLLLLRFLARALASTRMLVVGVYRNLDPVPGQPLTETLAELTREPVTSRILLGGLSESEVAEYVRLTAPHIASAKFVPALTEETEGNPLFVGEIVRLLAVEGPPSASTGPAPFDIPESVREVIARRLAHLSDECNRLLVSASVIGREFTLDALARLARAPEDELLDRLDEAMAARVVADVPGAAGRLRFAHVLIRDTLYDGLTTARRVRLHRQALASLESLYGDDPGPHLAELARHSIAGRDFDKGLRYAWRAGDRALALLAYEESARLYGTALEALELAGTGAASTRCELLLSLGEAQARAGQTPKAKEAFLDAADIARRGGLARELARAAAGYGGRIVWGRAGDDDRLVPLLEEGLAALSEGDLELRARLLARLAGALRDEHSRERRDALSREAVELARRTQDPGALAYALDGRAAAIVAPDTVAECFALGTELCEVAERSGDRERVVAGHSHRLIAHLVVGDVAAAEVDLDAMSRIAEELKQPARLWQACGARAMLALAAGRLSAADQLIEQALELGRHAQGGEALPVHRLQRYTLCDFRGSLEGEEGAISELIAAHPARVVFRCALALLHARLGRTEDAKRLLDELKPRAFSAVPFDQEWLYAMSLLVEADAAVGDGDSATVLYKLLVPWAGLNVVDVAEGIRGSVARYLGILATTMQRWDEAELHFEAAIGSNTKMGARPWLAHTQDDYARMLLARDEAADRRRALELIAAAVATYRGIGMQSWARRASELKHAATSRSTPPRANELRPQRVFPGR